MTAIDEIQGNAACASPETVPMVTTSSGPRESHLEQVVHRVEIGEVDGVGREQKTPGAYARGTAGDTPTTSRQVAVEMSINAK